MYTMVKFSDGFASSIIKGVRKECFTSNNAIPSDQLILLLLKLFILNPDIQNDDTDSAKSAKQLIQFIVNFLKISNAPSIITLKMQTYFNLNHHDSDYILHAHQEKLIKNIRPLQRIILQKSVRSKEDYDQLYHHICCMIVLLSGIGDPTDNEILKETIAALKSILTNKDLARFASKPRSLKERQLQDICRIVTGILVYNKNYAKTDDSVDLTAILENALQKCCDFLETTLLELDERTSSQIQLFLKSNANGNVESLFFSCWTDEISEKYEKESPETVNYIKAYTICVQQYKLYFRVLMQITNSLVGEFKLRLGQLQERLLRIRKTIKFRSAIPVIEIYPQFKNISLSWDKMQEISVLLNNVVDIISYLRNLFEKLTSPQLDLFPDMKNSPVKSDFDSKVSKHFVLNLNPTCELILPDDDMSFYSLNIEFSEFCIVMLVETKGILVQGIKEYGLIKYSNSYFCFSSTHAITKFCISPETYIETLRRLAFIWPEIINLLHLEEWLESKDVKTRLKREEQRCSKDIGIQTEVHLIPPLQNCKCSLNINRPLNKRNYQWDQIKNYRTHSVQTDISNFRKNTCTQTTIATVAAFYKN